MSERNLHHLSPGERQRYRQICRKSHSGRLGASMPHLLLRLRAATATSAVTRNPMRGNVEERKCVSRRQDEELCDLGVDRPNDRIVIRGVRGQLGHAGAQAGDSMGVAQRHGRHNLGQASRNDSVARPIQRRPATFRLREYGTADTPGAGGLTPCTCPRPEVAGHLLVSEFLNARAASQRSPICPKAIPAWRGGGSRAGFGR
jgi:hypothetical protein